MTWEKTIRRILMGSASLLAILGATIAGCSANADRDARTARDPAPARQADPPGPGSDPPTLSAAAERGKQLYSTLGCQACHMVNGQGGTAGPDLSNEAGKGRSSQWLTAQIRNPKTNDPQTIMPAYDQLTDENVADLVAYLQGLSAGPATGGGRASSSRPVGQAAPAAVRPASVAAGGEVWGRRCGVCHNLRPPSQYSDAQWAVAVQHMRVRVPLTGSEQRKILEFLQATN